MTNPTNKSEKEAVCDAVLAELSAYFGEPYTYGKDGSAYFILFGKNLQEGESFWSEQSVGDAVTNAMFEYVKRFSAARGEMGVKND